MDKQVKTLEYKVADIDGRQRMVKFYYGAFDNVDGDGDILRKGATLKTSKENGPTGKGVIRHYINHEFKTNAAVLPIGAIKEMGEDSHGPWVWSKIARTTMGNDVYSMYEDDMINSHSMGFVTMPGKSRKISSGREILEIKLYEVSTVTTWAANEMTPTIDVKEKREAVIRDTLNEYESLFEEPFYYTQREAEQRRMRQLNEVLNLLNF